MKSKSSCYLRDIFKLFNMSKYNLITIVGPTATGKTRLAACLANRINGEVISGDSRQVYRGMDLGTGKDYEDYLVDGKQIPYHLVDIADAGEKYNVYQFQNDFVQAFETIQQNEKWPVLCGGTGLYVESVLKGYKMIHVPANETFRNGLRDKNLDELATILESYGPLHNTTDLETKRRAIRAIEIQEYYKSHPEIDSHFPDIRSLNICVQIDRDIRRERISSRLRKRVEEGMIPEVKRLLESGVTAEDLIYYGLEYKFVTQHVIGELSFEEMYTQLEIAIHQFAKRQMTWFRGMERRGIKLHWLDASMPMEDRLDKIEDWMKEA